MKNTVQRQIILNTVNSLHDGHPSAEQIYNVVQKEYPGISKSTVYRNLHQLASEGMILSVSLPDSPVRFDNRISRHYHFRCKHCDAVFDVDIGYIKGIDEDVRSIYDFDVDDHDVLFKGTCAQCRQNADKKL